MPFSSFEACKLGETLIAEGRTLVSVYDVGSSEATEVLEDAPGSLGRARRLHGENMGVALVIRWEGSDWVYVQTLKWIVGCACEWMRVGENFKSTHDLAAWALANELGDSAVCDCRKFSKPTMELCTAAIC